MPAYTLAAFGGGVLFPAAMIYAGLMDFLTMKIRNALVIAIAVLFFVIAPLAGYSLAEIGWSTLLALCVFAITFTMFALGWIGGGDAKLAAATALWFGPEFALTYFILTALIGGALTLGLLMFRRVILLPARLAATPWIARLHEPRGGVPYGAAMAPAALIVLPYTLWMAHFGV